MWPFKKKTVEKSPYLYTFEKVGTQRMGMRGPKTVQASGDATVDELLTGLNTSYPSGTGWPRDCLELVIRIRAVDKPKQWAGEEA